MPNVFITLDNGLNLKGCLYQGQKFNNEIMKKLENGIWGEAVFTTAMSGYFESMTDPSYLGQHLIFSFPHIGNYPIDPQSAQSKSIHAMSFLMQEITPQREWDNLNVPLIHAVDTRLLVKTLTDNGEEKTSVMHIGFDAPKAWKPQLITNDLKRVTRLRNEVLVPGPNPLVVVDYGVKESILLQLLNQNLPLVVVNAFVAAKEILSFHPRMVLLSNGPGDPALYTDQIAVVKQLIEAKVPLRGICLGHQLIALALGMNTKRLPFGHRGINHPVLEHQTGKVLITTQNHGYAVAELERGVELTHSSLFDKSVQGFATRDNLIAGVQFHPEASPGPSDALSFFTNLSIEGKLESSNHTNKRRLNFEKILVIGSGPIRIAQGSEFDYSGSQACKVLKKEGLKVVLINSNPASIMTDEELSYKTYITALNEEEVKRVIELEKVDAILSTMGGQIALNLCLKLEESGYLKEKNIVLLGSKAHTINLTENRDMFSQVVRELGYKSAERFSVQSIDQLEEKIVQSEWPFIIRADYCLGGMGARLIHSEEELKDFLSLDPKFPFTIEKSLNGYKEVELEIMIDQEKNGVVVCSIENIDPCGVHTGDSIAVAPVLTISDRCLQKMRTMALNLGRRVDLVAGGANVQFAIHPDDEDDITVIEMNPRVSRSSALASKATGYPIAKISALLAIGYNLKEILNDITQVSPVCIEPSLDYVAVKIPLFPFEKFPRTTNSLGPQMKAIGEVLAIGSNFLQAFMKALRSMEANLEIPKLERMKNRFYNVSSLQECYLGLEKRKELCLLWILEALRLGADKKTLFQKSKITPWFIDQMDNFHQLENDRPIDIKLCKRYGLTDAHLGEMMKVTEEQLRANRVSLGITPVFLEIDTCSGEFKAKTPYYYSSYSSSYVSTPLKDEAKKVVIILGPGPNRIAQGVEFDYSCVKATQRLREKNYSVIMINSNPETVSTDYDTSNRLYISPMYAEDVLDIAMMEKADFVLGSLSGQTGIRLRLSLKDKIPFLDLKQNVLEQTEDRFLFNQLISFLPIKKTRGKEVTSREELEEFIDEINHPVIIRPSFVIGGESIFVVGSKYELENISSKMHYPSFVEEFLEEAKEYDVDLVRDRFGNMIHLIAEHVEYAGVHSGDSSMITPPLDLSPQMETLMINSCRFLANKLEVVGLINFQCAIRGNDFYFLEANPRASRTIPFLVKATKVPLVSFAIDALCGEAIPREFQVPQNIYAVKFPVFPFDRFIGDRPILGPLMRSTGESMGIDEDWRVAYRLAMQGANCSEEQLLRAEGLAFNQRAKKIIKIGTEDRGFYAKDQEF